MMTEVYGFWGKIIEVRGDNALFEFSHPSESKLQRMWVLAIDAGITPKPKKLSPLRYTGGGIVGCHPCGNDYGECECPIH